VPINFRRRTLVPDCKSVDVTEASFGCLLPKPE
jgi:hypothetical protein